MAWKTTSDVYQLDAEITLTIDGTDGESFVEIPTSLDTLNREVLLVWEVDFEYDQLPDQSMNSVYLAGGIGAHHNFRLGYSINENRISKSNLSDSGLVAQTRMNLLKTAGGTNNPTQMLVNFDTSPDSQNMFSRDEVPLAIITGGDFYFAAFFDSTVGIPTPEDCKGAVRLYVQRARADVDTYTALLASKV